MLVSPVAGQSISIDVQRENGFPKLNADGNWVWELFYHSDDDGGAAGVEFGLNFSDADLLAAFVTITGIGNGGVEVETPGRKVFGWEPGELNGLFPIGLEIDVTEGTNGQAFYAHGLSVLSPFETLLLGTFITEGPSTSGSLVSSVAVLGAYDELGNPVGMLPGTHGFIGESDGLTTVYTEASADIEAEVGDVNLDGKVDLTDLDIAIANEGLPAPQGWAMGDLDGSGFVESSEVALIQTLATVPEPTSVALLGALLLGGTATRRNAPRC